ncbi:mechanosensitive ion channel family protein [Neisseriaceae bacterium JH1-16]|nr:mechanosensitive ion channel family protein [Neisseriaceae bacterium JH1-16]
MAIVDWFNHLEHGYVVDLLRSFGLIAILILVRVVILRSLSANQHVPIEARRRWSVNLRNAGFLLGLFGLLTIWARELETFALSMVAFAAAMVVATKELIMCIGGAFLRTMSNSYTLGDHIEVGQYRGRVVDITLFSTTIMEIGPNHAAHQLTGRGISMPNSLLLTQAVIRENYMGDFVVHVITVPAAYSLDPASTEALLLDSARVICDPFLADARRHMNHIEERYLIDIPSVEPRIAIQPVDEKQYRLILRVAIPAKERHRVEQAILHRFMFQTYGKPEAEATRHAEPSHAN